MDFYHRTNYGQNEPVNKAILIFNHYYCDLFGFRDDESRYVFVMASVTLCLENGLNCDCNNILDVPTEALSMAVGFSFLNYFFSKIIIKC
jgi:hypothetical protein